jgi:hypothetical protein
VSNEDSILGKAQSRIEWHRSEIARLESIVSKLQEAIREFADEGQMTLSSARPPVYGPSPNAVLAGHIANSPFMQAVLQVLRPGEALTSRDIADRLRAVGYKSEAEDYYATVYNQLVWWDKKGIGVTKIGDRSSGVSFRRR